MEGLLLLLQRVRLEAARSAASPAERLLDDVLRLLDPMRPVDSDQAYEVRLLDCASAARRFATSVPDSFQRSLCQSNAARLHIDTVCCTMVCDQLSGWLHIKMWSNVHWIIRNVSCSLCRLHIAELPATSIQANHRSSLPDDADDLPGRAACNEPSLMSTNRMHCIVCEHSILPRCGCGAVARSRGA